MEMFTVYFCVNNSVWTRLGNSR